ncbi:MFS transporter [Virgisporangium aliadipatigenens]|uniref:MFS transporter n=1 Tax=Virgisporangium aliadipatigenens TaxID=741659 RepID=A0A8J4DT89_9ACTN|nr:MFS transporter [Virgisporangium aliadipatigenens]GIJ48986.1 MFS transporter [Virgisporangium aliadipatigenens]
MRTPFLIVANTLATLPVAMRPLLLVLLGHDRTDSFAVAGAGAAAASVCLAVSAPFFGRLLSSNGHRAILSATGVPFVVVQVGLAFVTHPVGFVVGCALLGLCTPPTMSSGRSMIARLVPPERLTRAYSLNAIAQEFLYLGGPLWVTGLVALADAPAAVLATCAVGALGLLGAVAAVPSGLAPERPDGAKGGSAIAAAPIRTILGVHSLYLTSLGAMWVLVPAFANELGEPGRAGVLVTVWSLGSLIGGAVLAARGRRVPLRTAYVGLLATLAVTSVPLATIGSLGWFAVVVLGFGLPLAPFLATTDELVATAAPPGTAGEAYGWLMTAGQTGSAVGSAVAGAVADRGAVGAPFLVVSVALVAALVLALVRRRTLRIPVGSTPT